MKKILLSVAAAVAVMISFTGCGKDDGGSGSGSISGTIVGKWECVKEAEYSGTNGNWTLEESYNLADEGYEYFITFRNDGTYSAVEDSEYTWNGTYEFDADARTLIQDGEEYKVESLTSSKLVLSLVLEGEYNNGKDLKEVTTFKKVNTND